MNCEQALRELEALGTAQNRKVYRRHGVQEPLYGVSFAHLRKLAKRVKTDHALARELWASGNHDARVLATLVADPEAMAPRELDDWAGDLDNYVLADSFTGLVARTPHAREKMEPWGRSDQEYVGQVGWNLLSHLAMQDGELPDGYFEEHLATIQREIHQRKNRVRHAMNQAVIAIGLRNPALEARALAAAARIGEVEVDHGETGCKTPEVASYIRRAKAQRAKQEEARKRRARQKKARG